MMDGSQAGSDDESDWDEAPLDEPPFDETSLKDVLDEQNEAVDNLNWPVQPDPQDSRYCDGSQHTVLTVGETFQQPNLANDAQYPANNYHSSYPADSAAYDGISLEPPLNPPWQPSWPDLALNSVLIDPNLYQANYATTTQSRQSFSSPLYSGFHDPSLVGSSSVPYNYYRQPDELENQQLYLSPSIPSAQSAPSDVLSVQSAPFSPLARTNDSTLLTSYFPGTPQRSGPGTERSFGSSSDKPFDCDQCNSRFKTRKDLDRHKHIHDPQAPEGQRVDGMFHCRCGKRNERKDNYKRHHRSCNPNNYSHDTFICKCTFENSDQADHLAHIEACPQLQKRRGRPPGSRSRAPSYSGD